MLQSKAGVEDREHKAHRSILADVDAGRISMEEFLARAEALMQERLPKPAAAHKPAEPRGSATSRRGGERVVPAHSVSHTASAISIATEERGRDSASRC
jgi:hypothetical protein